MAGNISKSKSGLKTGIEIKGYVSAVEHLPVGTVPGDIFQVGKNQDLYLWDGKEWTHLGTYKGDMHPIITKLHKDASDKEVPSAAAVIKFVQENDEVLDSQTLELARRFAVHQAMSRPVKKVHFELDGMLLEIARIYKWGDLARDLHFMLERNIEISENNLIMVDGKYVTKSGEDVPVTADDDFMEWEKYRTNVNVPVNFTFSDTYITLPFTSAYWDNRAGELSPGWYEGQPINDYNGYATFLYYSIQDEAGALMKYGDAIKMDGNYNLSTRIAFTIKGTDGKEYDVKLDTGDVISPIYSYDELLEDSRFTLMGSELHFSPEIGVTYSLDAETFKSKTTLGSIIEMSLIDESVDLS